MAGVAEVLASFDGPKRSVAEGVAQNRSMLWLGSGLSRGVVPNVPMLLRRLLTYLQERSDFSGAPCRFKTALEEVLGVVSLPASMRDSLDLSMPVDDWPSANDVVELLVGRYANVLDVQVEGEEPDFLMWTALDLSHTYGDPSLRPATEHLCIAILVLEGAITSAASANWDGLVESAIQQLAPVLAGHLRVVVLPHELAEGAARFELIKVHGCAVKALENELVYRQALVGRATQIAGWISRPENSLFRSYLENLASTNCSLVVGLSAQDANLLHILSQARVHLPLTWPVDPPAMVFARPNVTAEQRTVLGLTYGDAGYSEHRAAIDASAVTGAYACPTLLALVLFTLTHKLHALAANSIGTRWADDEVGRVAENLIALRDLAASGLADPLENDAAQTFVNGLVRFVTLAMSVFRNGTAPEHDQLTYTSITAQPVALAHIDHNVDTDALGYLALGAAQVGKGVVDDGWSISSGTQSLDAGVVSISTTLGQTKAFFVKDARSLAQLEGDLKIDMADPSVLVVHAHRFVATQPRSPATVYGRTGRQGAREIAVESLLDESSDSEGFFEAFKEAAAL